MMRRDVTDGYIPHPKRPPSLGQSAARFALGVVVGVALFRVWLAIAGCGDNEPPPCAELGCPDTEALICTRDGHCGCHEQACLRPPRALHPHRLVNTEVRLADAGVDSDGAP